jgi:hypothetical protein
MTRSRPRRDARRAARNLKQQGFPLQAVELDDDELQDTYDALIEDPDAEDDEIAELEKELYRRGFTG